MGEYKEELAGFIGIENDRNQVIFDALSYAEKLHDGQFRIAHPGQNMGQGRI